MEQTVVLANGSFPTHPCPLALLHQSTTLICTDGAARMLPATLLSRAWIVGDLDSLPSTLRHTCASRLIHDSCQENNDLTKAVQYCLRQGIRQLTILGATGRREDHSLGNISLLADYATQLDSVQMVTDYGRFLVYSSAQSNPLDAPTSITLESRPYNPIQLGTPISFFGLNPKMHLTAQGVQYPVEQVIFDAWWKGTLNVCTADSVQVTFTNGPLLIYLPFPETI